MKSVFCGLLVLCWSLAMSKASERELTIDTPTGKVYGTLMTPEQDTKRVVVLLICGSGATDRDGNNPQMKGNSIRYLAEDLCAKGVASLRYDKRGIARSVESAMPEQDIHISTWRMLKVGLKRGVRITIEWLLSDTGRGQRLARWRVLEIVGLRVWYCWPVQVDRPMRF